MTDPGSQPVPLADQGAIVGDAAAKGPGSSGQLTGHSTGHSTDQERETVDAIGEEIRLRVQRQAERVQQTASGVQSEAQRRVEDVQRRASRLRTQLEFRREKRDPIRYRLSIATVRAISWLARTLPQPVRLRIAIVVGWLVFRFNAGFRDNVRDNLLHVLGPDATASRIDATSRRIARNGILNILDLLTINAQTAAEVLGAIDLDPELGRQIERHRQLGRGTIVITAHLGSFDMIGHAIMALSFPTTILTGRTTYRVLFDAMSYLRRSRGATIVEPSPSGVREIYRSLRRHEVVGIVSDRDFFLNGLPVRFFGAVTTLPPGPVRIARDTGAMILPAFARRNGDRHEIRTLPAFGVARTADSDADVAAGMATMIAALEQAIGAEPEQWSIFQRVWPDDAPAGPSGS